VSSIAVIACDHGLGHVRRCVLLSDELGSRGSDVTLLAPTGAVERIRHTVGGPGSETSVVDFATATTPAALRAGETSAVLWHERLPDLDRFDRVVVDTLPEVLAVRGDAILVAQFLWHDVLEDVDETYRARAGALARSASLVIGSEPFAMPAVRELPGFRPVGLHLGRRRSVLDASDRAPEQGSALLIAGGATEASRALLRAVVEDLVRRGPGPWSRVHVDRELVPSRSPAWLIPATHRPEMYDDVAGAVVRPGLGTLTELLARDAWVVCVREDGNAELEHNARVVERSGFGVGQALDVLTAVAQRPQPGGGHHRTELDLDGTQQSADLILAHPGAAA